MAFLDYGLVRALDPGTLKLLLEIVQALITEDRDRCRIALEGLGALNCGTTVAPLWESA